MTGSILTGNMEYNDVQTLIRKFNGECRNMSSGNSPITNSDQVGCPQRAQGEVSPHAQHGFHSLVLNSSVCSGHMVSGACNSGQPLVMGSGNSLSSPTLTKLGVHQRLRETCRHIQSMVSIHRSATQVLAVVIIIIILIIIIVAIFIGIIIIIITIIIIIVVMILALGIILGT